MTTPSVLVLVSYKVFPAEMGGQKCVAAFYRHLASKTKVILVVAKENDVPENEPFQVLPFLYNHWWGILNLRYLYKLVQLIKEQGIDLVMVEHSYLGWLGLLLRWFTQKPVVIRSHNIEALRFRDLQRSWWRLYEWYEQRVHRKANHNFFITEEDKTWATRHWQLTDNTCTVISYGTDIMQPISFDERKKSREQLITLHGLQPSTKLFLFNGTLDYLPNIDALRIIITELVPILQSVQLNFRIFICGKGLSEQWEGVLRSYSELIYEGFVKDIDLYFNGADGFINPVTLGGGIKIKLVEALAHNQAAISTRSGAHGIPGETSGDRLLRVEDYDWQAFAKSMTRLDIHQYSNTPAAFYAHFNWEAIVQKALLSLQTL